MISDIRGVLLLLSEFALLEPQECERWFNPAADA